MEKRTRALSPDELMPKYIELLNSGAVLPIIISGGSMLPFLAPGRDSVKIKAIDRPLKRGDIVFYRRMDGKYVLHRIYRINGDEMWLVGDAQDDVEGPLSVDCAFAYVTEARRKNKTLKPGSFWWEFFEKTWLLFVGRRSKMLLAYSRMKR